MSMYLATLAVLLKIESAISSPSMRRYHSFGSSWEAMTVAARFSLASSISNRSPFAYHLFCAFRIARARPLFPRRGRCVALPPKDGERHHPVARRLDFERIGAEMAAEAASNPSWYRHRQQNGYESFYCCKKHYIRIIF